MFQLRNTLSKMVKALNRDVMNNTNFADFGNYLHKITEFLFGINILWENENFCQLIVQK